MYMYILNTQAAMLRVLRCEARAEHLASSMGGAFALRLRVLTAGLFYS